MKLLIVRHGDPIYETDSLTEKGKREVELLSERLCKENITAAYCSVYGRARLTAKPTLDKLGIETEYCEWLREFDYARINLPYIDETWRCWDILPEFLNDKSDIYNPDSWKNVDFIKNSDAARLHDAVCEEFDKLLAKHGYVREGLCYKAAKPNHDTVALFCHFGLGAILISHLLNCSPYSIWQNVCLPPSSVTTFFTEERRGGIASFRAQSIGDISHLYAKDEPPAFAGRFCECFTDDTRHD